MVIATRVSDSGRACERRSEAQTSFWRQEGGRKKKKEAGEKKKRGKKKKKKKKKKKRKKKKRKKKKKKKKRDAQRQYVVIGSLAPIVVKFLLFLYSTDNFLSSVHACNVFTVLT